MQSFWCALLLCCNRCPAFAKQVGGNGTTLILYKIDLRVLVLDSRPAHETKPFALLFSTSYLLMFPLDGEVALLHYVR